MKKPKKKAQKPRRKKLCSHPKVTIYCAAQMLGVPYTSVNFFYSKGDKGWSGRRCRLGKIGAKAVDLNQLVELSKYVGKPLTKSQVLRRALRECL